MFTVKKNVLVLIDEGLLPALPYLGSSFFVVMTQHSIMGVYFYFWILSTYYCFKNYLISQLKFLTITSLI